MDVTDETRVRRQLRWNAEQVRAAVAVVARANAERYALVCKARELGLTGAAIAHELGITRQALTDFERRRTNG